MEQNKTCIYFRLMPFGGPLSSARVRYLYKYLGGSDAGAQRALILQLFAFAQDYKESGGGGRASALSN